SAVLNGENVNFINKSNVPPIDLTTKIFDKRQGRGLWRKSKYAVIGKYLPFHAKDLSHPVHYVKRNDTTRLATWNLDISEMYYAAFRPDIHPKLTKEQAILWEIDDDCVDSLIKEP